MSVMVPIAMFGWIPAALFIFALLPPRRAVIVAFLFGWLFLPVASYKLEGLPAYDKMSATCVGVLLAATLFDAGRVVKFRPRWADIPMAVWCLVPFASALANGYGLYDGVSALFRQTVTWGAPYFIGRLYITDPAALRELAMGIFIGGLAYVPLCLYEIRMSPQLHTMVYGFHQHVFAQTQRFGGWRPVVFLSHGLAVGMWMTAASLVGVWLWRTRAQTRLAGVPLALLVPLLLVTTVLCKSLGALVLLALGLSVLWLTARWKISWLVITFALSPLAYMGARTLGGWSGAELTEFARMIDPGRAESLECRLSNEEQIVARARQRLFFGWGGWGDFLKIDIEADTVDAIPDGSWVIAFGKTGLVGLAAFTAFLVLPGLLLLRRVPVHTWGQPGCAPLAALAVVVVLWSLDCLFNAMNSPVFTLAAAGLAGFANAADSSAIRATRPTVGTAGGLPAAARQPAAHHVAGPIAGFGTGFRRKRVRNRL